MLGFAFKADTGDTRESAAITLIRDFQAEKANVNVYDPQVVEEQIWADLTEASPLVPVDQSMFQFQYYPLLKLMICMLTLLVIYLSPLSLSLPPFCLATVKKQVRVCKTAMEACQDAEAVVIATEWKEFNEIDWQEVYNRMNKPAFVFDGRLLVDAAKLREIGFKVVTIGRP